MILRCLDRGAARGQSMGRIAADQLARDFNVEFAGPHAAADADQEATKLAADETEALRKAARDRADLRAKEIGPDWEETTGQAGYFIVAVRIEDRYRGIAFQADEPGYPADQVELISEVKLREALGLGDGDPISFSTEP